MLNTNVQTAEPHWSVTRSCYRRSNILASVAQSFPSTDLYPISCPSRPMEDQNPTTGWASMKACVLMRPCCEQYLKIWASAQILWCQVVLDFSTNLSGIVPHTCFLYGSGGLEPRGVGDPFLRNTWRRVSALRTERLGVRRLHPQVLRGSDQADLNTYGKQLHLERRLWMSLLINTINEELVVACELDLNPPFKLHKQWLMERKKADGSWLPNNNRRRQKRKLLLRGFLSRGCVCSLRNAFLKKWALVIFCGNNKIRARLRALAPELRDITKQNAGISGPEWNVVGDVQTKREGDLFCSRFLAEDFHVAPDLQGKVSVLSMQGFKNVSININIARACIAVTNKADWGWHWTNYVNFIITYPFDANSHIEACTSYQVSILRI
ncbi:hypothetical protein J6590_030532 [Homalodisca vitripennis]|nr:hypothetical protein J6590_030532 [Homalodisca vitripennis]